MRPKLWLLAAVLFIGLWLFAGQASSQTTGTLGGPPGRSPLSGSGSTVANEPTTGGASTLSSALTPTTFVTADSASPSATGDPNWFLSSTAQSAAALVAIIGGFLVSRIISMSSERSGLRARCDELRRELNAQNRALVATTTERRSYTDSWFEEAALDDIVKGRGEIDPEAVARAHRRYGAILDEHIQDASSLAAETRTAVAGIQRLEDERKPIASVADLEKELGPFSEGKAQLYRKVLTELHPPARTTSPLGLDFNLAANIGPEMAKGDRERSTVEQLVREERRIRAGCESLKGQLDLAEGLLARLGRPEGVRLGFGVLAFFALTGVVPPIIVMSTEPVQLSVEARATLLLLFLVGLGSLFGYIYWAIRALVKAA